MNLCPTCGRRASERIGVQALDTAHSDGSVSFYTGCTHPCPDPLHDLADTASAVRDEAIEECAKVCESWVDAYPTDVFPEDSTSSDGTCARVLRRMLPNVTSAIRALKGQGTVSDIDDLVETFKCGRSYEAARADLAAIRRRAEDIALIAIHLMWCANEAVDAFEIIDPDWIHLYIYVPEGFEETGDRTDEIHLQRDKKTGLPILTDEAREALKGSK